MCGILGSFSKKLSPDLDERLLKGLRAMHHRGPDDNGMETISVAEGVLALGQTRLSIIDLSPGGHQPMHSANGRYTIVFNGEIYNYKELREELKSLGHCFNTNCDTEVLLMAWVEWGVDSLHRLVGMFAFAVFDRDAHKLILVRDAFGIKPLYYSPTIDGLVFASEMSALLVLNNISVQLNSQRVYDYLIHQVQDNGFETFVQGVYHLPPAHILQLDLHLPTQPKMDRWWTPSIAETSCLSFSDAAEQLRELFLDSVRLHLRSDVPLGVALSGGIDSSAIAYCMRYLEPNMAIHTFSYICENRSLSEEFWIDRVNEDIRAIPHKVYVSAEDFERDIGRLISAQGEPFGGTSMYAQMRVFQCAYESGIKVILEGQGGDEVLGGYVGYPGQVMLSLLERGCFSKLFQFADGFHNCVGRQNMNAWRALLGQLLPNPLYNLGRTILGHNPIPEWLNLSELRKHSVKARPVRPKKTWSGRGRRLMETLLQSLTVQGLPHLLRYGDRNSMQFSIENRVPFLTLPIVEFMLTLPEQYLVGTDGETKSVFKAAMRGIVPDTILDRRDKMGFDTPMREWMGHRPFSVLSAVDAKGLDGLSLFHIEKMKLHCKKAFTSSEDFNWQIWRIFNLIAWRDQLISTEKQD
jgi:asparagine synthase (glutamine-hydrolysing)